MKLIAAIDNNWNIGKDGDLLVHIPQDMKYFREKTMGKVVVMGRKTLESFPGKKPLKGRTNIVMTSDRSYRAGDAVIVNSIFELAKVLAEHDTDDVFVIGGGSVYRQLLPLCDTAYITKVDISCDADTSIPDLDADPDWTLRYTRKGGTYEGMDFKFCTYIRKKSKSPESVLE